MAPLMTPEDFQTATGLDVEPARLTMLLDQASSVVRDFCNWHIAPVETDQIVSVDGSGARVLPLPTLQLITVTSVVEDGTSLDVDEDFEWSVAGYLLKAGAWTTKLRGVVATITHGYVITPDSIQAVVAAMVERAVPSSAIEREQTGPFSVSWRRPEPTDFELKILSRYQVPEKQ